MITTEEMARLRVGLAELPGFDPVGLRVWEEAEAGVVVGRDDRPEGERRGEWLVYPATGEWEGCDTGGCDPVISAGPSHLTIDLADSATRDRVARWMAERLGLRAESTAGRVRAFDNYHPQHGSSWELVFGDHDHCIALAATDMPEDDAGILPDGSDYSSALALALVARHLGAA